MKNFETLPLQLKFLATPLLYLRDDLKDIFLRSIIFILNDFFSLFEKESNFNQITSEWILQNSQIKRPPCNRQKFIHNLLFSAVILIHKIQIQHKFLNGCK